ncbi:MAG: hypothetical protein M1608_15520 [Candidatus Omnitrophica bacterium]|nr:hypothetical protein [Candidatus Omnitrophota bacterium]
MDALLYYTLLTLDLPHADEGIRAPMHHALTLHAPRFTLHASHARARSPPGKNGGYFHGAD